MPAMARPFVLVLTGDPDHPALGLDVMRRASEAAGEEVVWRVLAEGVACEGDVARVDVAGNVRAALAGLPIDVNVLPAQHRKKHLLVSDMDSTIIQQECIDEMADAMGIRPRIAAITERAMRGELDFEAALRERLALLAGLDEAALQAVFDTRVTLMPGARTLVATMKAHGAYTALVSGGFTFFTSRVAKAAGFDMNQANQLAFADGRTTGTLIGEVLGKAAKKVTLESLAARRGLPLSASLAVGDGANDLDMIGAAGLGVAYRAKPVVAARADASITHGDLTALLYLQGYTQAQVVAA
jgi:phosphoserine phosphatase